MIGIVWFREDLRVTDNTALVNAAQKCEAVVGVYIIDPTMWHQHHVAACRVEFILRGLKVLSEELQALNIPLILLSVENTKDIPQELMKVVHQVNASAMFFNRQYEVNESKRDRLVEKYLAQQKINCYSFDDQVILSPDSVRNQKGEYFKIFTAYKRAWYKEFLKQKIALLKPIKPQNKLVIKSSSLPEKISGFQSTIDSSLWVAGERAAQKQLQKFIKNNLFNYDKERDIPSIEGTSKLSPYLAAGMISARQCFIAALNANNEKLDSGSNGAVTWMAELIWREFYKHILVTTPRVSMHRAYNLQTEKIRWQFNEKALQAWQQGKTGFPIIDAAMRQLNTTGWMHNRLRMIVAMYFTKNLFFNWRLGEEYFMSHLIDGDLAANNGGWQWCASTGTDAAPYFRVFNPVSQSERFDPEGLFIRKYCPELIDFPDDAIHDPYARLPLLAKAVDYPAPTVDLTSSRKHAIECFKKLKG